MKFSLIILISNTYDDALYCLKTLAELNKEDIELDIVLIDNGTPGPITESRLKNLELRFKNAGFVNTKSERLIRGDLENIAYLYASLQATGDWVIFLPASGFYFKSYLSKLLKSINSYYSTSDVLLSDYLITHISVNDTHSYNTVHYSPSIYRNKESEAFNKEIPLSNFIGLCIKRNKINLLASNSDLNFFKKIFELRLALEYTNILAGAIFIGDTIDYSKKQNLCDHLYYRPGPTN